LSPHALQDARHAHKVTDGEVNAHLTERIARASYPGNNSQVPHDDIPSAGPSRANNDIREYYQLANKPVTGGAWLDKPEIPSPSEILREKPRFKLIDPQPLVKVDDTLRPHRVEGAYENTEEYLGTTYELLREDSIRPLREAVVEVRKEPFKDEAEYGNNSLGIYEPVYITSLVWSPRGLATRVAFSLSRVKKHIK
jgi:helicase required for RNAi-mediated heterochromatin assembly 1